MPLDAMVVTALCREMEEPLRNARIDRISMPERDLLILSVHSREGNRKLLISLRPGSARVHFTEQSFENPPQPPMFCMLLRKYLSGARITSLEQPAGERMLLFRFDSTDELSFHSEKTLAIELMGKGLNAILLDESGHILDCLRRADFESGARRALLPGLLYELPPAQPKPDFFRIPDSELAERISALSRDGEIDDQLLKTFGGVSPLVCRELALSGREELLRSALALRARVREERFTPVMLSENGIPRDFSFLPIRQYGNRMESAVYPSFCVLLDEFYARRDREESLRRRGAELTRLTRTARDRLLRKLALRETELRETEDRELYRRRGDLITANMYRLRRGMESFEAEDYYEDGCPTVTIPLDMRKTPQQNAAAEYKKYTKAKKAAGILAGLIDEAREETAYLESVLDELERAEGERDFADIRRELVSAGYIREKSDSKRRKAPSARSPLHFVSESGRDIFVGRGNVENDELTFRIARRGDLWLHVQKIPGSHVVVPQSEGDADAETIAAAASLAVTYSRASSAGKTAVDCTLCRNVRKPSGARPGRVIYTEYTTLIAQGDEALAARLRRD